MKRNNRTQPFKKTGVSCSQPIFLSQRRKYRTSHLRLEITSPVSEPWCLASLSSGNQSQTFSLRYQANTPSISGSSCSSSILTALTLNLQKHRRKNIPQKTDGCKPNNSLEKGQHLKQPTYSQETDHACVPSQSQKQNKICLLEPSAI